MASKALSFYARFAPSFTRIGYLARGLPLRSGGKSLAGQSWLVTGATAGIGRALALAFRVPRRREDPSLPVELPLFRSPANTVEG